MNTHPELAFYKKINFIKIGNHETLKKKTQNEMQKIKVKLSNT